MGNLKIYKNNIVEFCGDFLTLFSKCKVQKSATSVSYYLILSFFPFLIIVEWFVLSLGFDFESIVKSLTVLSSSSVEGLSSYLQYVKDTQSKYLILAALLILISSLSSSLRSISDCVEELSQTKKKITFSHYLLSYLITIITLFLTYVLLLFTVIFKTVLVFLDDNLGTNISKYIHFSFIPYLSLFILIVLFLYILYKKISNDNKRLVFVCSVFVSAILVGSSYVFSKVMQYSVKYSLVYGSLSFLIIIMIWLYLCALVILSGACFTKTLLTYLTKKEI